MTCDSCGETSNELLRAGPDRLCPTCAELDARRYLDQLRREGRWAELEQILERDDGPA